MSNQDRIDRIERLLLKMVRSLVNPNGGSMQGIAELKEIEQELAAGIAEEKSSSVMQKLEGETMTIDDGWRVLPIDASDNWAVRPRPLTGEMRLVAPKTISIGGSDCRVGYGSAAILLNSRKLGEMHNGVYDFEPIEVKPGDVLELIAL